MTRVTKAEAAAANKRNSPLLRLPAELRNLIYHYALGNCTLILSTHLGRLRLYQRDIPAFPLLAVCTQIHAEVVLLPYSLNTFDFAFDVTLDFFLADISPSNIRMIKKLDLGTWTVMAPSAGKSAVQLQKFTGLEEVMFSYCSSRNIWKHTCEQRWGMVVKRLRRNMPRLRTAIRDVRYEKRMDEASELFLWERRYGQRDFSEAAEQ